MQLFFYVLLVKIRTLTSIFNILHNVKKTLKMLIDIFIQDCYHGTRLESRGDKHIDDLGDKSPSGHGHICGSNQQC